jgi:hypothetical protein
MGHRWVTVALGLTMIAAGACSAAGNHGASAASSTTSTTVQSAVELAPMTTAPAVTALPPPMVDLGDPAAYRAPVPGAVAVPAPAIADLCAGSYVRKSTPGPSVTDPIKAAQLAHGPYGDKDPSHWLEDQLIPVELGGAGSDPRNLWPQTQDMWALKNREENRLRTSVCHGETTLAAAQAEILRDWGPLPKP